MTSRDFCFWLQGCLEMGDLKTMDEKQVECMKRHLNLVFVHDIDPSMGGPKEQAKLNEVHSPAPSPASSTHYASELGPAFTRPRC